MDRSFKISYSILCFPRLFVRRPEYIYGVAWQWAAGMEGKNGISDL